MTKGGHLPALVVSSQRCAVPRFVFFGTGIADRRDENSVTVLDEKSEGARDTGVRDAQTKLRRTHGPRNLTASRQSGIVKPQVRRSLRRPARDVGSLLRAGPGGQTLVSS